MKRLISSIQDNDCKTLEGTLALYLVSKVMKIGGKDVIEKIFQDDHDLNEFIRLCRTKRELKRLCEFVLSNVARAIPNCKTYFKKLK